MFCRPSAFVAAEPSDSPMPAGAEAPDQHEAGDRLDHGIGAETD
jgi:hypothetical protein